MNTLDYEIEHSKTLEPWLQDSVRKELEWVRSIDSAVLARVYPEGFVEYRYPQHSNFLLQTIHNGRSAPAIPFDIDENERLTEEDLHTAELYAPLFFELKGIWRSVHVSRYFVDVNRAMDKAILRYGGVRGQRYNCPEFEERNYWEAWGQALYELFYETLLNTIDENTIVFNGHSMRDVREGYQRGDFCIIGEMDEYIVPYKQALEDAGFSDVRLNDPFAYSPFSDAGHMGILTNRTLKVPSIEFEINKRLYMEKDEITPSSKITEASKYIQDAMLPIIKDLMRKNSA